MNSRKYRGHGCKGYVNAALHIMQQEGEAKAWRDAKSYDSPWRFRVAVEYRVDSLRSVCSYPYGRSMVATATTSGRPVLAVSRPHYSALDNIKARCMNVPSLQTACA